MACRRRCWSATASAEYGEAECSLVLLNGHGMVIDGLNEIISSPWARVRALDHYTLFM